MLENWSPGSPIRSETNRSVQSLRNAESLKFHIKEEEIQVGKDREKAQSEKDSHSKNRGWKKTN